MTYNQDKTGALARLRYRDKEHRYSIDGFVVPSVTQTIDPLLPYDAVPREVREAAMERGTLVHALTAAWDRGEYTVAMAEDVLLVGFVGYVLAWQAFLIQTDARIVGIEERVYHRKYRYAGTLDRLWRMGENGPLALLEIKTGLLQPEHKLQTAAYLEAINDGRTGEKVKERYLVQLRDNGGYNLARHDDKADFDAFRGALALANWRMKNG